MAELRWASVLFVDLVEYSSLTDGWDAGDVRELLTGYFDVASTVVERYGGIVEKFIGDAVVAVWGSESVREDDAERCVRAGLELVQAVAGYGERREVAGLMARAAAVTGQVASWAGANGGLVAGDRVNLAARVQSVAEPGSMLVDDVTMRNSRATLAYADAGVHALKGIAEPVQLWRALRVFAGAGGPHRVDGLEAPFVGRVRELTFVKELFHAAVEGGRARVVAILGVAGIGKSRLSWEFEKYVEGLAAPVFWHRGRCPSFGDGIAFWALAEMVRHRFAIAEDDAPDVAAAKLSETLPLWLPDADEREFVEQRLGVLVGAGNREFSREELFAGWRLFFERLAVVRPVVLVIEDVHWADGGLLDFVDYLLDWSDTSSIYLLALARPDVTDRRPAWLADRHNCTTLHLDPLSDGAMGELLADLVPDMPTPVQARIISHAGGIPLYAVETIRSLVDKDLVIPRDGVYRLVGEVEDLDVPASLTAVIAARLDGLPPEERELIKALAVLGDTFARHSVAAVSDAPAERLDAWLRTLVRKEFLSVRSDPLTPQRDQYTFVQAMVRSAAHGALSRRERRVRHHAVATHLRSAFPDEGEDVAEVIAAHLLAAYTAARADPDAEALRVEAERAFARAGARASSVGSPATAETYYKTAADLSENELDQTRYTARAAEMAEQAGHPADALALLDAAAEAHRSAGRPGAAARLEAAGGWLRLNYTGQTEQNVERLEAALLLLEREGAHDALPDLHAVLAAALMTSQPGRSAAADHLERGVILATALGNHEALMAGLHTKADLLQLEHRVVEAAALYRAVAELARDRDDLEMEARARDSLGRLGFHAHLPEAAEQLEASLSLSNRLGSPLFQSETAGALALLHFFLGRWDEADRYARRAVEMSQVAGLPDGRPMLVLLLAARGELAEAEQQVAAIEAMTDTDDPTRSAALHLARHVVAIATGLPDLVQHAASRVSRETLGTSGMLSDNFCLAWPLALEAVISADRLDEASSLLGLVADAPVGYVPPYLRAQLVRYEALLAAARGEHDSVEAGLNSSMGTFREMKYSYWLARAQADLARWLIDRGRKEEAAPLLTAAVEVLSQLRAHTDLSNLDATQTRVSAIADG